VLQSRRGVAPNKPFAIVSCFGLGPKATASRSGGPSAQERHIGTPKKGSSASRRASTSFSPRGVFVLSSSPALRRLGKRQRYQGVVPRGGGSAGEPILGF